MLATTNILLHRIKDLFFRRHDNTLARSYNSWEKNERVDIVPTKPSFGGREGNDIESNFPKQFRNRETADLFPALIIRLPNPVFRPYASIETNLLFFEKGRSTRNAWSGRHPVPEGQNAYLKTQPILLKHLDDCATWWEGPQRLGRENDGYARKVSAEDMVGVVTTLTS